MHAVIDRFEGDYAVVELPDGKTMDIKRDKLPCQAKEGDVLLMSGDIIRIDKKDTLKKKAEIEELMKDIWE